MPQQLSEEEIYKQARKRVEDKKGFYIHLGTYIVINAALVIIWALSGAGYPWFVWPLFGWGVGLIFHFLSVFVFDKGTAWEQREVEKEAERIRKESGDR